MRHRNYKMYKLYKLLASVMALSIAMTMLPVSGLAADIQSVEDASSEQSVGDTADNDVPMDDLIECIGKGTCGENLTWKLTKAGILTISGNGEMDDYKGTQVPWYLWKSSVKKIIVENGVTSIGKCAFYELENLEEVSLPDSIGSIGDEAFYFCNRLESIQLPDSVTSIGKGAFELCRALKSVNIPENLEVIESWTFGLTVIENVVIPDNVKRIEGAAFRDNSNLKEVSIPAGVSYVDDSSFAGCSNLNEIRVDLQNKDYCSVEGVLFNKNMTNLMVYPAQKSDENYTIPDSVKSLAWGAFQKATNLRSVSIPNTIDNITEQTFYGCRNLQNVVVPSSVKSIQYAAFSECYSLNHLIIPASVEYIGSNALYGVSDVYFYGTRQQWEKLMPNSENINVHYITDTIAPVKDLKIGGRAADALRLNWSKDENASGYIIELLKDGQWTRIARIGNNNTTTFRAEKLEASTMYRFRIRSFGFDNKSAIYSDDVYITAKTAPSAVKGAKIGGTAKDALRLNWEKNYAASGYIIEQLKDGTWTRIARIGNNNTTTYRVEKLQADTTYQFRIKAFDFDGTTPLYSSYQTVTGKTNAAVARPTTVTGLKIGGRAKDALRLNWDKNSKASGYIIEQYKDGAWTRIARIGSSATTTYRVEKLSSGTTYKFRIQAFGFDGKIPLYSSYQYISGNTK